MKNRENFLLNTCWNTNDGIDLHGGLFPGLNQFILV